MFLFDKELDDSLMLILNNDEKNKYEIIDFLSSMPSDFLNEIKSMVTINDEIKQGQEIEDVSKVKYMVYVKCNDKTYRISSSYQILSDEINGKGYSASYIDNGHLRLREFKSELKNNRTEFLRSLDIYKKDKYDNYIGRFEYNYGFEYFEEHDGVLVLLKHEYDKYSLDKDTNDFIKQHDSTFKFNKPEVKVEKHKLNNDEDSKELLLKKIYKN